MHGNQRIWRVLGNPGLYTVDCEPMEAQGQRIQLHRHIGLRCGEGIRRALAPDGHAAAMSRLDPIKVRSGLTGHWVRVSLGSGTRTAHIAHGHLLNRQRETTRDESHLSIFLLGKEEERYALLCPTAPLLGEYRRSSAYPVSNAPCASSPPESNKEIPS